MIFWRILDNVFTRGLCVENWPPETFSNVLIYCISIDAKCYDDFKIYNFMCSMCLLVY